MRYWIIVVAAVGLFAIGCVTAEKTRLGHAKAWSYTCSRCHNLREPESFSDEYWDIATLHMRIHANIPAREYRLIRDFLMSAN